MRILKFSFFKDTCLCLKSSPVKYSYLPKRSLEDNTEMLAASLPKSY